MRKCVLLLFTLVALPVSAGPAWRWVDADGTIHYSDRPVPGAVEVFLPDANSPAPRAPSTATTSTSAPVATTVQTGASAQYSQLAIASPAPEETLWNTGGTVNVDVAIAPRVQPGHRLGLLFDGELIALPPSSATGFTLNDVFRGIHTVQAVILDANNTQVLRSAPVQFMVQQTSLLNPNRRN